MWQQREVHDIDTAVQIKLNIWVAVKLIKKSKEKAKAYFLVKLMLSG